MNEFGGFVTGRGGSMSGEDGFVGVAV